MLQFFSLISDGLGGVNRVDTWLIYLPKTGPLVPICSNGSVGADQAARRKSLVATDDLGISQKKGSQHRGGVRSENLRRIYYNTKSFEATDFTPMYT